MSIETSLYATAVRQAEGGKPFLGNTLRVYPEVGSTMSVADRLIAEGRPSGMTVIALKQTAGRGSDDADQGKARAWWSGEGNLMLSRIVGMSGYAMEAEFIAALAVAEIIADLLPRETVTLKYPNDVLVDDAKICGCLVLTNENNFYNKAERKINLGVGVNLASTPPKDAVREKASVTKATCLKDCGAENMTVANFMSLFDERLNAIMQEYSLQGFVCVLKRMGFADCKTGEVHLRHPATGEHIQGIYSGFSTRKSFSGVHVNYLHLETGGKTNAFPLQEFTETAIVKRPLALNPVRKSLQACSYV